MRNPIRVTVIALAAVSMVFGGEVAGAKEKTDICKMNKTIEAGKSYVLKAKKGGKITKTISSDTSVVRIAKDGRCKALRSGKAVVTLNCKNKKQNYTCRYTIKVKKCMNKTLRQSVIYKDPAVAVESDEALSMMKLSQPQPQSPVTGEAVEDVSKNTAPIFTEAELGIIKDSITVENNIGKNGAYLTVRYTGRSLSEYVPKLTVRCTVYEDNITYINNTKTLHCLKRDNNFTMCMAKYEPVHYENGIKKGVDYTKVTMDISIDVENSEYIPAEEDDIVFGPESSSFNNREFANMAVVKNADVEIYGLAYALKFNTDSGNYETSSNRNITADTKWDTLGSGYISYPNSQFSLGDMTNCRLERCCCFWKRP